MAKFTVKVARVGEGEHQAAEFTEQVEAVSIETDGSLRLDRGNGNVHVLAASGWGAFKVVRVPDAADRV